MSADLYPAPSELWVRIERLELEGWDANGDHSQYRVVTSDGSDARTYKSKDELHQGLGCHIAGLFHESYDLGNE